MKKYVMYVGWLATLMAILMYVSYIDQIIINIKHHKGSVLLPLCTFFNCCTWMTYALLKPEKDWPIFTCNLPGALLGLIAAITAIYKF